MEETEAGADTALIDPMKVINSGANVTHRELTEAIEFNHMDLGDQLVTVGVSNSQNTEYENEEKAKEDANTANMPVTNLGRIGYTGEQTKCDINKVKVRLKREGKINPSAGMMDEFIIFLDKYLPNYHQEFYKFPPSFHYDSRSLQKVEGDTRKDTCRPMLHQQVSTGGGKGTVSKNKKKEKSKKKKKEKNSKDTNKIAQKYWAKECLGQEGEEQVYKALDSIMSDRTGIMFHRFEKDKLFHIAKQTNEHLRNEERKASKELDSPLTEADRDFQRVMGVDIHQLEDEVDNFVKELFADVEELCKDDLLKAIADLSTSSRKVCSSKQCNKDIRPIFKHLLPEEQTNYKKHLLKNVEEVMKAKKTTVKHGEIVNCLKHIFIKMLNRDGEFDYIVIDKETSSFIQIEVKSYPQSGILTENGLRSALTEANDQLRAGNALFQHILGPAANLCQGWTRLGLACFPEIESRTDFKEKLGVSDHLVKFILTKEELTNDNWFQDLKLSQKTASKEEYRRLLAIIIGSSYVSFQSQELDYQKYIKEATVRIVGDTVDVHGVGSDTCDPPAEITLDDLAKKPLGHLWNILFWNDEQMDLLAALNGTMPVILCGDYGGGKSSVLIYLARKAQREGFKVYYITTTSFEETVDTEYILDIAMEDLFMNSAVEVVSLKQIRNTLKVNRSSSVNQMIKEWMRMNGDKEHVKVFIDEFPVSKKDLNHVYNKTDSDLVDALKVIDENSCQAFIALKTTCLLDTVFTPGSKSRQLRMVVSNDMISFDDLKTYIEDRAENRYSVKVLSMRMRNTSSIGNAAIANTENYSSKSVKDHSTARCLPPGISNTTVSGIKPDCILSNLCCGYKPNMSVISVCLKYALTELLKLPMSGMVSSSPPPKVAVLCGEMICPEDVAKELTYLSSQPFLYDGGVKIYKYATAEHHPEDEREAEAGNQKENLKVWLKGNNQKEVLVTHNRLFAGMEAPTVILITKDLGTRETAVRSGVLRAVARLIIISDINTANKEEIGKNFNVIEM